jgi:hypothetical protein
MADKQSEIKGYIPGRNFAAFAEEFGNDFNEDSLNKKHATQKAKGKSGVFDADDLKSLDFLGLDFTPKSRSAVMDSAVALQTTGNAGVPLQFLQSALPGLVRIIKAPLDAEEILGLTVAGNFWDEQVYMKFVEHTGSVRPYGDKQGKPNSGYNVNYMVQTVIGFEAGIDVTMMQEARNAAQGISDAAEKRESAMFNLAQLRDWVAFFGYNAGNNRTYGQLNHPSLPAFTPVSADGTGSSTLWADKTWKIKQQNLTEMFQALNTQTKGRVDPYKIRTTLQVPTTIYNEFSTTNDIGTQTLKQWLNENYPLCRLMQCAKNNTAASGLTALVLFADEVTGVDSGTDSGQTFAHVVPSVYKNLGVQQLVGGSLEGMATFTAGTLNLRPYAVVCRSHA